MFVDLGGISKANSTSDGQLAFCGIDQKLNVSRVLQLADAGIVERDAVAANGHGRIKAVGDEFPPYHLISGKAEACLFGDALGFLPFFAG